MKTPFNLLLLNKIKSNIHQKGQASIELVMSLLLFVAMLGTLLSLSMYMYINHTFLTAAKEGARMAAVEANLANAGTWATGEDNVIEWVQNFVSSSSGIALADDDIALSGPDGGTIGNRTVTVTVSYEFQNPVQIRTFMNRLSGGSASGLDTFTITNTATMRYEE
jgi:hypothetical protein